MTPGAFSYYRLPLALLSVVVVVCIATVANPPAGRISWLLEVGPGLAGIIVLLVLYKRFPMSQMVYVCVFLHVLILIYGGYYTYAETPLGNWAKEAFDLSRNHYDRVGHLALGIFPCLTIREVLLRQTPLVRGGWLYGQRRGFVDTILDAAAARPSLRVVTDEVGCPTYVPDLVGGLVALFGEYLPGGRGRRGLGRQADHRDRHGGHGEGHGRGDVCPGDSTAMGRAVRPGVTVEHGGFLPVGAVQQGGAARGRPHGCAAPVRVGDIGVDAAPGGG